MSNYSKNPFADTYGSEKVYCRIREFFQNMNAYEDSHFVGAVISGDKIVNTNLGSNGAIFVVDGNSLKVHKQTKYLGWDTSPDTDTLVTNKVDLVIDVEDSETNMCTISCKGKYLYRNNSVIKWGNIPEDEDAKKNFYWGFERLFRYDEATEGNEDFFGENCGYHEGPSIPDVWRWGMHKLFCLIFNINIDNYRNYDNPKDYNDYENKKGFFNLYGAKYADYLTSDYRGKFHTGVDININETKPNAPVYSPINGYVTFIDDYWGTVSIYDKDTKKYFTFMHMWFYDRNQEGINPNNLEYYGTDKTKKLNLGTVVEKEDIIGWVSNRGLGESSDGPNNHVHVEINNKVITEVTDTPNAGFGEMEQTIPPYEWFNKLNPKDGFFEIVDGRLTVIENPPTGSGGGGGGGGTPPNTPPYTPPPTKTNEELLEEAMDNIWDRYMNNEDDTISPIDKLVNAVLDEAENYTDNEEVLETLYSLTDIKLINYVEETYGSSEEISEEIFAEYLFKKMCEEAGVDIVE